MAGASPTYLPLDLDALRTAVAAGRTVRVGVLPTGQFPAGTAGRVREVGSPEIDGAEFIRVELVVGGAKDVVPFAPGDLSPLRRGQAAPEPLARPASRRTPRTPARPAHTAPTLSLVPPSTTSTVAAPVRSPGAAAGPTVTASVAAAGRVPMSPPSTTGTGAGADGVTSAAGTSMSGAPVSGVPVSGVAVSGEPASSTPAASVAATAATPPSRNRRTAGTPRPTPVPPATGETASGTASGPATSAPAASAPTTSSRTAARRGDRAKRQPIAVTLSTTEPDHTGWSVQATVGSRTVVKPTPVHPAQAWTLVTGLGQPEVEQFVAGALAEHRRQAQERADRLARELAEARAELAAYPDL